MYQDLRSKLEMYKSSQEKKPERPAVKEGIHLQDDLQGLSYENEYGKYFVIEKSYPLSHIHGGYSIGHLLELDISSLNFIFKNVDECISIKECIFLDTETTGLSGGAGTVAFLIGVGFFEKDCFIMRQFFMRDYDEEPGVLRALNELLAKFKGIVSFNGKSFDWNLLQSRFIFNRMKIAMKEPLHLDLLYPSRKIWKLKLESCRLISLEENILGKHRVGDIPGAVIPSLYFKYLENRNTTEIKKVINHNKLDILSMVSLLAKIRDVLENPLGESTGEKELLSIGKIFEDASRYETMLDCYSNCIQSENEFIKGTALRRLAGVYKRNKDYESASKQWEKMVSHNNLPGIYPLIELAKYYEHKKRDMAKAMEMVERAIKVITKIGADNKIYYTDIKKRYDRLKRKAGITDA